MLAGVVKVGEALVDDWAGSDAVEERRAGDSVAMSLSLPFASQCSPTGHYAVCATDCLILYLPHVRPRPAPLGPPPPLAPAEALRHGSRRHHFLFELVPRRCCSRSRAMVPVSVRRLLAAGFARGRVGVRVRCSQYSWTPRANWAD